ncbi:MAG: protoporphyrinogen oxidase HemJ [Rhizobiaceae bacterium]
MSDPSVADGNNAAKRAAVALALFAASAGLLLWLGPAALYDWIKALHVIAAMSWMAGMLYLPRLFVYHADQPIGSEQSALLKVMEQRLLRVIINPAMMLTWVLGIWLAWYGFQFLGTWLHVKFLAVIALSACHGYLSKSVRLFASDQNTKPSRHWRLVNEVPTVLMIVIVIMVIVKPF